MPGEPMHTASKGGNSVVMHPSYIYYASLSAMFNLLHSSTNQELFKKHVITAATVKIRTISITQRRQFSKMNGTQRHWLVHKNVLYVMWYAKRHLLDWSNIEQWKHQAHTVAVIELWKHQLGQYSNCKITWRHTNSQHSLWVAVIVPNSPLKVCSYLPIRDLIWNADYFCFSKISYKYSTIKTSTKLLSRKHLATSYTVSFINCDQNSLFYVGGCYLP